MIEVHPFEVRLKDTDINPFALGSKPNNHASTHLICRLTLEQ
jgi:hypothetical protein